MDKLAMLIQQQVMDIKYLFYFSDDAPKEAPEVKADYLPDSEESDDGDYLEEGDVQERK